jgi:hypothetical protein
LHEVGPAANPLRALAALPKGAGRFVSSAVMQSPPLDDRALRALVRAAESPLTAGGAVRLMFAESGIAKALRLPPEPGDHPSLDDRPIGPAELPK